MNRNKERRRVFIAKTFSNLQTGTRVYLDEAVQTDFLDSEVQRSVNYAYHDLVTKVIQVYELFYETITPFTYAVVANQQEYTIDPTIIKVTRVEINYAPQQSGSVSLRAIPIKSEEALLNLSNSATSGSVFNAGYYLHGNLSNQTIGFIPFPTQGDTTGKSISVWGITIQSDMVNSGDLPNIPYVDNFGQLIELRAASILLSKGQQEEANATKYGQLYQLGVDQMQQFLRERQADGVRMIIDVELDNLDFQTNPPF